MSQARLADGQRVCSKCTHAKPIEEFRILKPRGYRHSWCRPCERAYNVPRVVAYKQAKRAERRTLAATLSRHRCASPFCCDGITPQRPGPSYELALMYGLGRRNVELAAQGLPRIGVLKDAARGVEVWLSRQAPARVFPLMRAARAWSSEQRIRLIRLSVPD